MKKPRAVYCTVLSSVASLAILQACGKPGGGAADSLAANSSAQTIDYAYVNQTIIQPKCMSCHSSSFASYQAALSSGMVVPNSLAQSGLYTSTKSGQMPKGGPSLSTAELATIAAWIQNGAPLQIMTAVPSPVPLPVPVASDTPTPTPTTTPSPTSTPTPTSTSSPSPSPSPSPTITATFSSINSKILQPRCVSCHGSSAGVTLSSYAQVIATAVSVGNPTSSKLYTSTASGGSMPLGGTKLNATELKAVSDWITAGAANN